RLLTAAVAIDAASRLACKCDFEQFARLCCLPISIHSVPVPAPSSSTLSRLLLSLPCIVRRLSPCSRTHSHHCPCMWMHSPSSRTPLQPALPPVSTCIATSGAALPPGWRLLLLVG